VQTRLFVSMLLESGLVVPTISLYRTEDDVGCNGNEHDKKIDTFTKILQQEKPLGPLKVASINDYVDWLENLEKKKHISTFTEKTNWKQLRKKYKYAVLDGHHRLTAYEKESVPSVPIKVISKKELFGPNT
jgi:hypothetical protein